MKFEEKSKVDATKMENEWGSQIRSYVMDDGRVWDHCTNYQTSQTEWVWVGCIDEFLKAYLMNKNTVPSESED